MRRALILFAALVAVGVAATPASAALYGIQGVTGGPGTLASRLAVAARTGAKLVRVQATWAAVEPVQGSRDPEALAALDRVVDGAARRGMRTVLVLSGTPCWASSAPAKELAGCAAGDASRYRPTDPTSAVPVASFLAARYASRLAAFQVWNEPDQSNEQYWAGTDKVQTYVAMVRALYGPLKQAAPRVPVLAGSFVGKDGRWLRAMYAAGARGSYDGLAVQFYGATLRGLRATRAVQRQMGDSAPLWLTEFGATDCYRRGGPAVQLGQLCVSSRVAAQATKDVITAVRSRPWIAATIQYALFDGGGYTFGLHTARGRPKSALRAVRDVLTRRVRRPRRPSVRLRPTRAGVVVSGTATTTDLVSVSVRKAGVLRFRARLFADRLGRYRVVVPQSLGARGLGVRVSAGWTGRRSARLR